MAQTSLRITRLAFPPQAAAIALAQSRGWRLSEDNDNFPPQPLPRLLKRGGDLLAASLGLIILSPIFLVLSLIIRRDGGPAIFCHERVGKNGRHFLMYKFRTMPVGADALLEQHLACDPHAAAEWEKFQKLKNDARITPLGKLLRRYSIDELPQLINVLLGEMSLVGPRPIQPNQKHYYAEDFIHYISVLPGLTGPWQVSGRNQLGIAERVRLESHYARQWNLGMDAVIVLKTIPALFKKGQAF